MSESSAAETLLAHIVFFSLNDRSHEACQKLVDSCHEFLTGHPGTVHVSVGLREPKYDRSVNDDQFDVALHLVFENQAAHDAYQISERHQKFIAENKASWKQVRVFDSNAS
jgi:hypothetical protein